MVDLLRIHAQILMRPIAMSLRLPPSRCVFVMVCCVLVVSWGGVVLFDMFNVWGWGAWFTFEASPHMFEENNAFFYAWFDDRSPIEWMQWLCLGSFSILSAYHAGRLQRTSDRVLFVFWALMAVGGMLLVLEDAGSPRHRVLELLAIVPFLRAYEGAVVVIFELFIYFPALAVLPVYAFYRSYHRIRQMPTIHRYLIIGFGFYAVAAFFSASSGIGFWYNTVGTAWLDLMFSEHLLDPDVYRQPELGFWLMDTLVEESLELVGAAGLLSAALAQYHRPLPASCTTEF